MVVKRHHALQILVIALGSAVILSWIFLITPQIIQEIDGLSYHVSYVGTSADIESLVEGTPPTPIYVIYRQWLGSINSDTAKYFIEYSMYNAITDETLWTRSQSHDIDVKTGRFLDFSDTYFIFPRNIQKQNYNVYLYETGDPIHYVFEEETSVDGLNVYRFSCTLTANMSEFYPEYAPEKVYSDYECNAWIEPITGDEIQYEENWTDYILKDGETIPITISHTHTTEFSKAVSIEKTLNEIKLFELYEKLIPLIFSITVSGICAIIIFSINNKQKS